MAWIDRLFNKHKFARRGVLVWAMVMITLTIFAFLDMAEDMAKPEAVYVAIISLLGVAVGLYQWSRGREP